MGEDVEVCFVCCDEEAVTKCEKCGAPHVMTVQTEAYVGSVWNLR